jgi:hypothetical protein
MRNLVSGIVTCTVVLWSAQAGHAVNQITNPPEGAIYLFSSNINADGFRNLQTTVRVRLLLNGAIGGDSGNMPGLNQTTWSYNFTAPSGGWTVSNNWKCRLATVFADGTENQVDEHGYRIVVF